MSVCPNCGTPKPPPNLVAGQALEHEVHEEVKKVGRFGAIVTAIGLGLGCAIVVAGGVLTFLTGCCGACPPMNTPPRPAPEVKNPLAGYIPLLIAGLIGLWVILAIIIFVIRRRKL